MTWDNDRHRIAPQRLTHRPCCTWFSDPSRQVAIGNDFSTWHFRHFIQYSLLKRSHATENHWKLECLSFTPEIYSNLLGRALKPLGSEYHRPLFDAGPKFVLSIYKLEAHQTMIGHTDEHFSYALIV